MSPQDLMFLRSLSLEAVALVDIFLEAGENQKKEVCLSPHFVPSMLH